MADTFAGGLIVALLYFGAIFAAFWVIGTILKWWYELRYPEDVRRDGHDPY